MANITVSTDVDALLQSADNAAARDSLGVIEYPFTTDFISGVQQTRNLTTITNSSGFYNNTNLTSVYLGSNVTSLGTNSFFNSSNLTSVTLGNNITSLGDYCLRSTGITSINVPDSVTSIGYGAFDGVPLTSITFGVNSGLTTIGGNAFYYCSSLTSITIPASVTSIGYYAFAFSNSLSRIECLALTPPTASQSFYYTPALSEIHVPAAATGYGSTFQGLTVIADL